MKREIISLSENLKKYYNFVNMKILRTDPEKSEKEIQVYLILVEIKDMETKTNTLVRR